MNCPKHPHVKMTALFTSYVCDICDPPDSGQLEEPTEPEIEWPKGWTREYIGDFFVFDDCVSNSVWNPVVDDDACDGTD